MTTAIGIDYGRVGRTVLTVLTGDNFEVVCPYLQTFKSISSSRVEEETKIVSSIYNPDIILLESNGPGGVFLEYINQHNLNLPIVGIDTSTPLFTELTLWNDIKLRPEEFHNGRAGMYWLVRLMFRDKRIKLLKENLVLFSQLSSINWSEHPQSRKIILESKKGMKSFNSSLGSVQSSGRSPDEADSLCLAALGYAVVYQESMANGNAAEDEVIEPDIGMEGFFPIGMASDELG